MDWYVRVFIRAAVAWLGLGVALGLAMVLLPVGPALRPAHMHANLVGFVSMMIFGVAYHVLPRFAGRPLHRRRWAEWHVGLANVGLALQVAGFLLRLVLWDAGTAVLAVGGGLTATGVALFIANVWVTVGPGVPLTVGPSARVAGGRSGPTPQPPRPR